VLRLLVLVGLDELMRLVRCHASAANSWSWLWWRS